MTEPEQYQLKIGESELAHHRSEAIRETDVAKRALERADYHVNQIRTWESYISGIGQVALQIVPPMEPYDAV